MSVAIIKARSRHRRELVEVANRRAHHLLDDHDRVLVVYEHQIASIYYERDDAQAKSRKAS